jgi:hypothetical protein
MLCCNYNQTKNNKLVFRLLLLTLFFIAIHTHIYAQRYLADYDSTLFIKDTLRPLAKRFNNIHFSGYIQPQYQIAQAKGIDSYAGGDFQDLSDNRFMIRRARIKLDYAMPGKEGNFPAALFTFQFEATERDVNVRDVFVRIFEPGKHNFSLTAGLFARPFGYEINLSSSVRETPERGRMSQILMPSERDLGTMLTYESQKAGRKAAQLKFDIGLFNGQGKSGPAEFDSYKDLISRLSLKPVTFSKQYAVSGGLSFLRGGWAQATKYKYEMGAKEGNTLFLVDSNINNIGAKAPRHYYGADVQMVHKHGWGKTELRGEYWTGKQPGTDITTVNPGSLPLSPTYIRKFDGAFIYFLQNIVNNKWELMAKYDWYDPNIDIAGNEIGKTGTNLTPADIRYNTLGIGFTHYFTDNLKVLAYYDRVKNERTALSGYTQDKKDDVFTLRIQMRF